jgi:hypothetical protein
MQRGKVEEASGHKFQPKTDFNMSLIEFELVPVRCCCTQLPVFCS